MCRDSLRAVACGVSGSDRIDSGILWRLMRKGQQTASPGYQYDRADGSDQPAAQYPLA